MRFQRITVACAGALLLATCASCSVDQLDLNGDGFITRSELFSAAFDYLCGDQEEPEAPADETPDDETPADKTPGDETPADETPTDETPSDETPINARSN